MEENKSENKENSLNEKPRTIGKSSVTISAPIAVGTWAWGDSGTWGYNSYDSNLSDAGLEEAFFKTVEKGIDFFDTAEAYGWGKSEELLGAFTKKWKAQNPSKNVIIATKFVPMPHRITKGSFMAALKDSLKRLQVDSIDLYQVHGPAYSVRRVEYWAEAMADAVKAGLIKAVGVSNYNTDQLIRTHKVLTSYGIPLASNQVEFSLLRNNAEKTGLMKVCSELGVDILAYSPLGMGRLTGKYTMENQPKGNRKFGNHPYEKVQKVVDELKVIGAKHGKSAAQVAINWVISKGAIPLVGVKNSKQLEENVGALGWRLTEEEVKQLDAVSLSGGWSIWQENS